MSDLKSLKDRIAERKESLRVIIAFVESFLTEHGKITKHEVHSDHINMDKEFKGLDGFDIFWSTSRSYTKLKIHYRPANGTENRVLEVSYGHSSGEGCLVSIFSNERYWYENFNCAMMRAEEIVALKKAEQTKAEQDAEKLREEAGEELRLREEAKRLGLA